MPNRNTMRSGAQAQVANTYNKQFYVYQKSLTTTVAAPATPVASTGNINIQADADFVLQQLSMTVFDVTTYTANPNCTILITDTGSGTNLFDGYVQLNSIFGNAQLPFILPTPRLITRNSTITLALNSNNSTGTVTYYLNFIGHKLFRG